TSFTVTNTGNSVQDFSLSAANLAGGSLSGVTDNFDTGACSVKVESGTTAGYQALEDTATFIDELAPDASKTVYVVCAIPLSRVDGDGAVISLTAEARVGGTPGGTVGAALTQTTGANTGNDTATLTQITDTLNTTLVTFDANLITGVGTAAPATTCSAATGTATSAAGSGFKVDVTGSTRTGYPKYYTSTSSLDGIDF